MQERNQYVFEVMLANRIPTVIFMGGGTQHQLSIVLIRSLIYLPMLSSGITTGVPLTKPSRQI